MKQMRLILAIVLLFTFIGTSTWGMAQDQRSRSRVTRSDNQTRNQTDNQTDNQIDNQTGDQDPRRNRDRNNDQEVGTGETLKIDVELVQIVFSVVDDRNRLVSDLKQAEIEVIDNGQRQELELFQRSNNLPMMLSVLIDMSGSQEFLLPDEKTAVTTFFDSFFRPGKDYGALLTFQGETSLAIGLTSNLNRLKTALQRIKREETFRDEEGGVPNLGTALFDAIEITAREVLDGKTARRVASQDAGVDSNSNINVAKSNTSNRRSRTRGINNQAAIRRAICVLTDGVDTASNITIDKAIRSAQRVGVAVYALGMGDRFRYGNVNQQGLDQICRETGGRAFYPKSESELRQAFQQIASELSSQYILAYYPSNGNGDQNFRSIEIKTPRQPGWQVIHRRGYLSDK